MTPKDSPRAERTVDFIVPQINDPGVGVEASAISYNWQHNVRIDRRDRSVYHLEVELRKARFQQDL